MSIAYSLLVHRNPAQIRRLLDAIYAPHNAYAIHVDLRAREAVLPPLQEWAEGKSNVVLTKSIRCTHSTWSLVEAELAMAEDLRRLRGDWTHLINLSGQDFPIVPTASIERFLEENLGRSFMLKIDPMERWADTVNRRFRDLNLCIGGRSRNFSFLKRPNIAPQPWFGSSQWKILAREALDYLLDDSGAVKLRDGFRLGWVPDETYIPTVLFNSPLASTIDPDYKRYIDWNVPVPPKTLTMEDLPQVLASDAFFARKVDADKDDELLQALENHIRAR